ncbi:Translation initiation factor IF-2 [bacterium HR11]|nr:Translation initiation factor IF-2 [bacterium HR11]
MRVFELARELGRPSKEVITILNGMGILVTSHASVIDADVARKVRDYYIREGILSVTPKEEPKEVPVGEAPATAPVEVTPPPPPAPPSVPVSPAEPAPVAVEPVTPPPSEVPVPPVSAVSVEAPPVSVTPETPPTPPPSVESPPSVEPSPVRPAPPERPPRPPRREERPERRPERREERREREARLEAPRPETPPGPERIPERPPEERYMARETRPHKRAFREELRRVKERRDYVRMGDRPAQTSPARTSGARLGEWHRASTQAGGPPVSDLHRPFVPPPPPKVERKRPRTKEEEERELARIREREKELVLPKRREEDFLPRAVTEIQEITIPEGITVKELAQRLNVKAPILIKALLKKGHLMTLTQTVPMDLAVEVAEMFGYIARPVSVEEELLLEEAVEDRPEDRVPRPPVVTVMGHVDHGKTTLLDTIRKTNVAAQEAGGITQKIGAYQVEVRGRKITFIDTPGHEAFTQMRARGAKATDIVILVVAADDGVMPQTVEAIDHARAAGCPIVVAINKIDKPNADPEKVKRQLAQVGLTVEEWGGQTIAVPISAKQGTGIEELLEMVLLVADLADLRANPKLPARGIILESKLDPKRGVVATVLIQNGTLRVGDVFVAGATWGRVRAMFNDRGQRLQEAPPSTPVEVLGFEDLPQAGDTFQVLRDETKARRIAQLRQERMKEQLRLARRARLEDIAAQVQAGREVQALNLLLKADTQGSLEALQKALEELSIEQVRLDIVHAGVGGISTGDVLLAAASDAIILGFNVRPDKKAREQAEQEGVEIRYYNVIYDAVEDIKNAVRGMLKPQKVEQVLGVAEVRQTFRIKDVGVVAGCFVREGKVVRGERARLIRDQVVVYDGRVNTLRRFKEDVREVPQGYECGLTLLNFQDIKEGDLIEVYTVQEVAVPEPYAPARAAS